MKNLLHSLPKNLRLGLFFTLSVGFLIWVLQSIFFSPPVSENIPVSSHQKLGNGAFWDYLKEKNIRKGVIYEPAYQWAKKSIRGFKEEQFISKEPGQSERQRYKFLIVEKKEQMFWLDSEKEWFRRWVELGNELIIFTKTPEIYWEAMMLPIEYEDKEKIKKAAKHFPLGFEISLKNIVKKFIFNELNISRPTPSQEAHAESCYDSIQRKNLNIVGINPFIYSYLNRPIQSSGWKKVAECRNGFKTFFQRWKYKEGYITFVFGKEIINNEFIALADNIVFLNSALGLSSQDNIVWDAFHNGVLKRPNLSYYIFYTVPGRIFLWLLLGLILYFWYKNMKLRKYPLPKKENKLLGASLIHFKALSLRFSKKEIVNNAYWTLIKYLSSSKRISDASEIIMTDTKVQQGGRLDRNKQLVFLKKYFSGKQEEIG